jgi:hypothetical protein
MYQPKQGHWLVNTKHGDRRGDTQLCQRLDDVKKLTPDGGVGEETNRRSKGRETASQRRAVPRAMPQRLKTVEVEVKVEQRL